jgi:hypothetical protein
MKQQTKQIAKLTREDKALELFKAGTIVYPDTNIFSDTGPVGATDHSLMLKNGYIRDAGDWRAVEMSMYFTMLNKDQTFPDLNQSSGMIFRSGAHHSNDAGCNGVGYLATIRDTGDGVVTKEFKHPDARVTDDFTTNPTLFTRYPKPSTPTTA